MTDIGGGEGPSEDAVNFQLRSYKICPEPAQRALYIMLIKMSSAR